MGHETVFQEDDVPVMYGDLFAFARPQAMQTGYCKLSIVSFVRDVCHFAVRNEVDALIGKPALQWDNQRVVLVVDRSLHSGERFNARELQQETQQVALELHGAVPGLKREGRGPHIPERRLEKAGRKAVGDAARKLSSLVWLSFRSSRRSCMENPMEATGTFARRRSTSLAMEFDL